MLQKTPKPQISSNKDVALAPPGRHRVAGETGLYLYVSPDAHIRRWIFRYTSPVTQRVTETGLDMAAHVSLSQAKAKAAGLRRQIASGVCPIHAKRAERSACITFKEAADAWIETHKPSWRGKSMEKDVKRLDLLNGMGLLELPNIRSQIRTEAICFRSTFPRGAGLAGSPITSTQPDARNPRSGRATGAGGHE
jgi:hypothetical protein